ncbi:hypothetical protein QBC33DRAFT_3595 [Phialemonium atrogriseum]|uniref:DUF4440 domain-containing protein n=1 Tax=Phialemonium atrogriseum TaxID=1093897 RepID=A0AAJ0FRH3_9PEZI|nr:uncharacterized protein QBC33DRAFT_3595 [Phialemonium atrogriseum]KAK1772288.1 hypothetical protein QBC33DRAFT_3595 [Phialemonium atrogriseum]
MPTVLGLTNETQTNPSTNEGGSSGSGSEGKAMTSSTTLGSNERLDTISKRNNAAAVEMETLLWRAMCESPEAAKEYLAHDCVMINPLLAGTDRALGKETDPSVSDALEGAGGKWAGYRFRGDPQVVEIDLMAVALVYRVSLFRKGRKGVREVKATASSSWRQTAGADWLLCSHHVAFADDDDDDEE